MKKSFFLFSWFQRQVNSDSHSGDCVGERVRHSSSGAWPVPHGTPHSWCQDRERGPRAAQQSEDEQGRRRDERPTSLGPSPLVGATPGQRQEYSAGGAELDSSPPELVALDESVTPPQPAPAPSLSSVN